MLKHHFAHYFARKNPEHEYISRTLLPFSSLFRALLCDGLLNLSPALGQSSRMCRIILGDARGTSRVPTRADIVSVVLWMIYQTLLRHRELTVTPMIPRFSRTSIPSQTVMPLTLTILSVGPSHLGSYLISPRVNPVYRQQKITCKAHLFYQRNAFGILRYRERPWCVGVKQSFLGQASD